MESSEQLSVQPQPEKPKKPFLDRVRNLVASKVNESSLSTKESLGYESTVGFFGGKLVSDPEGKLVWDTRGLVSNIDRRGDWVLRTVDEHVMKEPLKMFLKHPREFIRFLFPGPKRYRGSNQEIAQNAQRLGVDSYYGLNPWGIEVKKPEIFTKGIALQDIYRSDQINSDILKAIDRFESLVSAAQYLKNTHDQFGPIGEVLPSDIIFQSSENGKVINPILNIPDIIYNPEKYPDPTKQLTERKATDILDFLFSIGLEELRRSPENWDSAKQALNTIINNYGDETIIKAVKSLALRGRLTMEGNITPGQSNQLFTLHNRQRFGTREDLTGRLRDLIIEVSDMGSTHAPHA